VTLRPPETRRFQLPPDVRVVGAAADGVGAIRDTRGAGDIPRPQGAPNTRGGISVDVQPRRTCGPAEA
jgi:hypothetical protein